MVKIFGSLVMLLTSGIASAGSPFCVVYSGGQLCNYYDISACQSAARSMQGACVANAQIQQAQTITPIQTQQPQQVQPIHQDTFGSFMRGQQQGQALRIQREEHQANMRLREAQIAAAQQAAKTSSGMVFYDCSAVGGDRFTDVPIVGCKVIFISH